MKINRGAEILLAPASFHKIEKLYAAMQEEYDRLAGTLGFSCLGCPDNCCDSFFLHHTYAEWAYLRAGFSNLPAASRDRVTARAWEYVRRAEAALGMGERPRIMCPLNEEGLCVLYTHRMLICRLHGLPAKMIQPDGRALHFPGCFRCQELTGDTDPLALDRTDFLRRMAGIELELRKALPGLLPKTKLTLAQMIVKGPPRCP